MLKYSFGLLLFLVCTSVYGLRIAPTLLEGYTYLPNGPITFNELRAYNPKVVKDPKHNGIAGLEMRGVSVSIKRKGQSEFKFYSYFSSEDNSVVHMDTLASKLSIDDSLYFSAIYYRTTDYKGSSSASMFKTVTKYGVKTETIAALIRKGESLINVFANPCRNETMAKLDVSEKIEASYYVLDGFGRQVIEGKMQDAREEIHINLRDQPSGAFVFYIRIENELFRKKIVKL